MSIALPVGVSIDAATTTPTPTKQPPVSSAPVQLQQKNGGPAETPAETEDNDDFERSSTTEASEATAAAERAAQERQQLLDHMMRGVPNDSSGLRGRIRSASESFSTDQLRRMDQAGVRFAQDGNIPRTRRMEGTNGDRGLATHGRYLPEGRVVQMRSNANSSQIRHEMAHAWDDVRNDRLTFDDNASQVERERMITRLNLQDARGQLPEIRRRAETAPAGSARRQELEATAREIQQRTRGTPAAFHSDTQLRSAYDAYRTRMGGRPRDQGIDFAARDGHSMRSPREFYAEGYNSFHAGEFHRERVRRMAPELYRVLYNEASAQGTLPEGATAP